MIQQPSYSPWLFSWLCLSLRNSRRKQWKFLWSCGSLSQSSFQSNLDVGQIRYKLPPLFLQVNVIGKVGVNIDTRKIKTFKLHTSYKSKVSEITTCFVILLQETKLHIIVGFPLLPLVVSLLWVSQT